MAASASPAQSYTVGPRPERIDRIAAKLYGTERSGTVEQLLAANPGVALMAPFIPARTVLTVPPVAITSTSTFVPPWS